MKGACTLILEHIAAVAYVCCTSVHEVSASVSFGSRSRRWPVFYPRKQSYQDGFPVSLPCLVGVYPTAIAEGCRILLTGPKPCLI